MKRIHLFSTLLAVLFCMACAKNPETDQPVSDAPSEYFKIAEEPEFVSRHDISVNELAKALSKAVREDKGLRQFIHRESLKQFDGDYDFLVSRALNSPVHVENLQERAFTKSCESTFEDVLRSYLPETKSGEDILSYFQEQFPELQVAIPVHAEDWDPDQYIPVVAFVPEEYEEFVTETVPGYDAEGNYVEVDAINPPDVPVIVISHNEGYAVGRPPIADSLLIPDPVYLTPEMPTGFEAVASPNGIVLSWNSTLSCSGYYVWKKGPGEASYTKIATLQGRFNVGYTDNSVVPGYYYQYYINSYSGPLISDPTLIITVQAPMSLSSLVSFSVVPSGNSVECRWENGSTEYADVVIEHKGPNNSAYSTLYTETGWNTVYLHNIINSQKGKRHNYRAYRRNDISQSDAKTDYIYPPFRNVNDISYVYIHKIYYRGDIDGWLSGKAEFSIIATYYNSQTSSIAQTNTFVTAAPNEVLSNVLLKTWRCLDEESGWYDMVSIHMIERDWSLSAGNFNLDVNYSTKLTDDLNVELKGQYVFSERANSDYCGYRELYYYDDPETTLQFNEYDIRLTLSENP